MADGARTAVQVFEEWQGVLGLIGMVVAWIVGQAKGRRQEKASAAQTEAEARKGLADAKHTEVDTALSVSERLEGLLGKSLEKLQLMESRLTEMQSKLADKDVLLTQRQEKIEQLQSEVQGYLEENNQLRIDLGNLRGYAVDMERELGSLRRSVTAAAAAGAACCPFNPECKLPQLQGGVKGAKS